MVSRRTRREKSVMATDSSYVVGKLRVDAIDGKRDDGRGG